MERHLTELVAEKNELLKTTKEKHFGDMSRLQLEIDVLGGLVTARVLLEKSIEKVWLAGDGATTSNPVSRPSKKLEYLLSNFPSRKGRCQGLSAYLNIVADDNDEDRKLVLGEAQSLYATLSSPLHTLEAGGEPEEIPVELFERKLKGNKATLLAFVAILKFSGRDIKLYQNLQLKVPNHLNLRIPLGCAATEDEIKRQPFS